MPSSRAVSFALSITLWCPLPVALFAGLALTACSSTSGPELRASNPVIFVSSRRAPPDIFNCLEDRLPALSTSKSGGASELVVGPNAWLVTLTPSQYGSTVKVQKSERDYSGLPEPEMRFNIARCTT
ncbi:sugar ABC transporter ATPase [Caballeronia sordidicola]|uniref:Sugar ABC transporter ATPase n=1 Tax=Caballeronia sordidicola TaxID=196367 RepID=A0A158GZQ1_CABSO|nr:sugar ABC transporter ATPase [Caballeronia sordidicola]